MNILLVTDLYPVKGDEIETPRVLHDFVLQWKKQGHDIVVIKPNFLLNSFLRNKPFYPTGFYENDGVKIFNVNYFTPFMFKFIDKIPPELKFADFDAIIAHMPSGEIFAGQMARIMKKKLICGVHCSDIDVLTQDLYKFYFKDKLIEAYNYSKKIACRSVVLKNEFSKLLPDNAQKCFVAASGISADLVNTSKKISFKSSPFEKSKKIKVLTCANLIPRKNIDKLILAINELQDFELEVIGSGSELENLKNIADEKTKFLGRLSHPQVLDKMRNADIFILPSSHETFGQVYMEAMASGCVTVCTKDDGISGIIVNEKNGFLCEPTKPSIKSILNRIKTYEKIDTILENSIKTALEYSLENCAEIYLQKISH